MVERRRHDLWKSYGADGHSPDVCEHELRSRHDPIDRWHCCAHWQRKLSHKLNAKEFAAKSGVATAGLLWAGSHPGDIPFDDLPAHYIVKLSNGSGSKQVIAVDRGMDLIGNVPISPSGVASRLTEMLTSGRDPDNVILVEEFVGGAERGLPKDYKFFCFHGRAQLGYVCDRNRGTLTWYDRTWARIPDAMHFVRPAGGTEPPPPYLAELLSAAERLAAAYIFPFVRIDLYEVDGAPIFGEFTHTPFGDELSAYTTFANEMMGRLWADPGVAFSVAGGLSQREGALA